MTVTPLCPTLGNPTDCSQPGSSVHGILQARTLASSYLQNSIFCYTPHDILKFHQVQNSWETQFQSSFIASVSTAWSGGKNTKLEIDGLAWTLSTLTSHGVGHVTQPTSTSLNKAVSAAADTYDSDDDKLINTGSFSLKPLTLMLKNVSRLIKLASWWLGVHTYHVQVYTYRRMMWKCTLTYTDPTSLYQKV